jgi:hypothetical protein
LSQSNANAVSTATTEEVLFFFNQCFKFWGSFPQQSIDDILSGISAFSIVLCWKIDFLSSFIQNFLQIAVLLPGPTSLNFLNVLCEILMQVSKQSHNIEFLKVFPSNFLETLCDILSHSIEPSLLWNSVFVFMSLISNLASFECFGEYLIVEAALSSEFGFAASKSTMRGCSFDLEVAFFIILHSLEFLHDCQYSSRFLNILCSTCPSMTSSCRVMEVALSITSRLKNVHLCVTQILKVLKCQDDHHCANTDKFTSRCQIGILLTCCTQGDIDIASEIWNCSSRDGHYFLVQHLKEHLSSFLEFGNPIQKGFMKILSFCPNTSELVAFVFEFQCAPIYALQTMGHLLRMQPEQKELSERNIEDIILYLRRWNDFLLDSKKSMSELDRIWGFWIDLWLSLSVHVSYKAEIQKRSLFLKDLFDLIGEKVCSRLLFSLSATHMHTSNQNQIVVKACSFICKFWLEQQFKICGIRKALIEQLMQNPELQKQNYCGFYFEALME